MEKQESSTPAFTELHPNSKIVIQTQDVLQLRLKEYLEEVIPGIKLGVEGDTSLIFSEESKELSSIIKNMYSLTFLFRHVHRFYITQKTSSRLTWDNIQELIDELQLDLNDIVLRIVVYPKSLLTIISSMLPQSVKLHPKNFTHILSVIVYKDTKGNTLYQYGIAPTEYLYDFDEAISKVDKDSLISRARFKLMEALERTDSLKSLNMQTIALDIGASPGGWSLYLSDIVKTVYSVDPADLRIQRDNIIHIKKRIQDSFEDFGDSKFGIVVSDMTEEPQTIIDVIKIIEHLITIGGVIVLTCKFPKRNQKNIEARMETIIAHFHKTLPTFEILRAIHMLSNYNERCIIAKKITGSG